MTAVLRRTLAAALLGAACSPTPAPVPAPLPIIERAEPAFEIPFDQTTGRWFKGNTHAHTALSDGDSPPEVVVRWYRSHGYDFLVLSDHNVFADPKSMRALTDSTFLLIPGEEITTAFQRRPIHVNGLNIPGVIPPRTDSTMVGTIQANVDAVREVDGVPHINHPNFRWAFGWEVLAQIRNDNLIEIWNGHPHVHNEGGGGIPSVEAAWDTLLTRGKRIFGIAVDDAHHFQGEFSAERSNPGRGWVAVIAPRLEPRAIVEALDAGRFYASTGVTLDSILITPSTIAVHIRNRLDFRHRTVFIGDGGRVLHESTENPAIFRMVHGVTYVRAKVYESGGAVAWIQPVFVRR